MKRMVSFVLVLSLLVLTSHTFAQEFIGIGLKGGFVMPGVNGLESSQIDFKAGYTAGGYISYKINDNLTIQQEFFYITKGFKAENQTMGIVSEDNEDDYLDITTTTDQTLNYVELPLLLVFNLTDQIHIIQGGYMDLYLNGTFDNETVTTTNIKEGEEWISTKATETTSGDVESGDVNAPGWGLIVGIEYELGKINCGARYSFGLSNVAQDENNMYRHNAFQFLVGFSF